MSEQLNALQRRLGYTFHNQALLRQALTCQSAINERHPDAASENYQALEFIGDAALKYAVASLLYSESNRAWSAETMHNQVVAYIGVDTLARIGRELNLDQYIIKGKGVGSCTDNMLGDAVEAILGAIVVDQQRKGIPAEDVLLDFIARYWSIGRNGALQLKSAIQHYNNAKKCCCCCGCSSWKCLVILCLILITFALAALAFFSNYGADL